MPRRRNHRSVITFLPIKLAGMGVVVTNDVNTVALPPPGHVPIASLATLGVDMTREEKSIVVGESVGSDNFEEAHVLEVARKKEEKALRVS